MNDKREKLLSLFTKNTEYHYHLVENEAGHFIYVAKENDKYNTDVLEFKLNSIPEAMFEKIGIVVEKAAPSVYFTEEKDAEKLTDDIEVKFVSNDKFSKFVKGIKHSYRHLEIKDFIKFKTDPEGYKAEKEQEHLENQKRLVEEYNKQIEDSETKREELLTSYENNIPHLVKDFLKPFLDEGKKFNLDSYLQRLVFSLTKNTEKWPKDKEQLIIGNETFKPVSIDNDKMTILVKNQMTEPHTITLKLNGSEFEINNVAEEVKDTITNYDFLMKVFDVDVKSETPDWETMEEYEKLDETLNKLKNDKSI